MSKEEVNHPSHYNSHPSGIETGEVVKHMTFYQGSLIKYLMRCKLKGEEVKDLRKARACAGMSQPVPQKSATVCRLLHEIAAAEPCDKTSRIYSIIAGTHAHGGYQYAVPNIQALLQELENDQINNPG